MARLWEKWVPGVLSQDQMRAMCREGLITGVTTPESSIDSSSIDLHLTAEAYRLLRGSVKPFGSRFLHTLKQQKLATSLSSESDGTFVLEPKQTYLFRLAETLQAPSVAIWGQATAKSSVGRLDVLARLIVNGTYHYEGFDPEVLGSGSVEMFVEITPITFPVRVREGVSVNQLRFFYGKPDDCELRGSEIACTCFSGYRYWQSSSHRGPQCTGCPWPDRVRILRK